MHTNTHRAKWIGKLTLLMCVSCVCVFLILKNDFAYKGDTGLFNVPYFAGFMSASAMPRMPPFFFFPRLRLGGILLVMDFHMLFVFAFLSETSILLPVSKFHFLSTIHCICRNTPFHAGLFSVELREACTVQTRTVPTLKSAKRSFVPGLCCMLSVSVFYFFMDKY